MTPSYRTLKTQVQIFKCICKWCLCEPSNMLVCTSQPYPNYFIPLPIWRAISVLSVHYTIVNTNFNASGAFSFFPFLLRAVVIRMSMWHAAYNVLHYTRPSLRFSAIFAFGISSSFVQLAYLFSLLMVSTHSKLRLLFRTLALCWALSVLFILNFPSFAVLAVSSLKRSFVIVGRVGDFWPFLLLVFFFFGLFPAFVTCPYPQDRSTYGTRSLFNFFSSWPSPFEDGTLLDASQTEWKQLPHVLEWRAFVKYGIPRMTLSVLFFLPHIISWSPSLFLRVQRHFVPGTSQCQPVGQRKRRYTISHTESCSARTSASQPAAKRRNNSNNKSGKGAQKLRNKAFNARASSLEYQPSRNWIKWNSSTCYRIAFTSFFYSVFFFLFFVEIWKYYSISAKYLRLLL